MMQQRSTKSKDEMFRYLSNLVQSQSKLVAQALNEFESLSATPANKFNLNKKLIACLECILKEEYWDSSLFLRNLSAPYRDMRQQVLDSQQVLIKEINPSIEKRQKIKEDQTEIFILMYQVDGYDVTKWNDQLSMLLQTRLRRPIYTQENSVNQVLRARFDQANDAYIIAVVPRNEVLCAGQFGLKKEDKFGQPLIYLSDNVLTLESFVEFVHLKNRYFIVDGQFVPQ